MNKTCYNCGAPIAKATCEGFPEVCEAWKPKPPATNYGRIIRMTPEELAEIMVGDCPPNYPHGDCREYEKYDGNLDCCKCWLDWLRSPVEENK